MSKFKFKCQFKSNDMEVCKPSEEVAIQEIMN